MSSYSENYKKRMEEHFNSLNKVKSVYQPSTNPPNIEIKKNPIEIPSKIITKRENYDFPPKRYKSERKKKFNWSFIAIFALILILLITSGILLIKRGVDSNYFFIVLIIVCFILFYFIYRFYQKIIFNINPRIVLLLIYFLLIINMYLANRFYSIEWGFLFFIIATIIFYDSLIDSRFLIMPALLLLGYIPFLLTAKFQLLSEQIAIYAYYFLVAGVGLQCAEYFNKKENLFDFELLMKEIIKRINWLILGVILGIIEIIILILNRFYNLELLKLTILYLFSLCLAFYIIKGYFIEK